MTGWNIKKAITPIFMLLPCAVFAKSGSVNYSWGADALASMHDFVVTMMMYEIFEQNHTHISYL